MSTRAMRTVTPGSRLRRRSTALASTSTCACVLSQRASGWPAARRRTSSARLASLQRVCVKASPSRSARMVAPFGQLGLVGAAGLEVDTPYQGLRSDLDLQPWRRRNRARCGLAGSGPGCPAARGFDRASARTGARVPARRRAGARAAPAPAPDRGGWRAGSAPRRRRPRPARSRRRRCRSAAPVTRPSSAQFAHRRLSSPASVIACMRPCTRRCISSMLCR